MSRTSLAWLPRVAIAVTAAACVLLPGPEVIVKTLRSGAVNVPSADLVIHLRSGVTLAQHPHLCMILDTLQYAFRPRAEKFQMLPLTDTTVYPRIGGTEGETPIVLRAVLEGKRGEWLESSTGAYGPGSGMGTPYDRAHLLGENGEVVCLSWTAPADDVTYVTLRLHSTRPLVVHDVTWHFDPMWRVRSTQQHAR